VRPCPWVSCRWHLLLDVTQAGSLALPSIRAPRGVGPLLLLETASDDEVDRFTETALNRLDELTETCALDVAERDGETLEQVGQLFGFCRERSRQIEVTAIRKLTSRSRAQLVRKLKE
jgi:hypothetical protein